MEIPMVAERGTGDAERLGVKPLEMREVLAVRSPRERSTNDR
jgi:hypothetical protein